MLPTLDPTAMGWKNRRWYLAADPRMLVDTRGNIGPTGWWGGQVVGGWDTAQDGEVRTALLSDPGTDAAAAVDRAAQQLQERLGGTVLRSSLTFPLRRVLLE